MTIPRPTVPRRMLAAIALGVMFLLLTVPAVSADEFSELYIESENFFETCDSGAVGGEVAAMPLNHLIIHNAQYIYGNELTLVVAQFPLETGKAYYRISHFPKRSDVTRATIGDWARCDIGYFIYTVGEQEKPWVQYYIDNIEYISDYPSGYTGKVRVPIYPDNPDFYFLSPGLTRMDVHMNLINYDTAFMVGIGMNQNWPYPIVTGSRYSCGFAQKWKNQLNVSTGDLDYVEVTREISGKNHASNVTIYNTADSAVYLKNIDSHDIALTLIPQYQRPYQILLTSPTTGNVYNVSVDIDGNILLTGDPTDPDNIPVVVYVKSTQTGALLNDVRIIIKDTTTTPWSEVVNQTLPSGYDVVYLKKDPGFDPTQYQISVTVPDYQQVVPTHFFRVTGPMSVVVEMEPLEGGPVDEDNSFLDFYVTDINGNPVSNAQVYVGGQLRWTNAQGYTQFEVAKNTSYSYEVSKSGYVTVRGSATVGNGPRYAVNVVLGPKTDPTEPPITDPDIYPVNVYVKSSQTGTLLADARVIIKDTTTDPWSEVVNQTLPSGHGAVSLAKDPGFDPTQYQISAKVPGYQQVVPALFFRVTGPTNVVVEMEPLEGGPVDENNTFLEFYVRNLDGNPVSNAHVFVDGQLRWTNAQGWIQFEVAKNASYPYTVSKSGYVTIEGIANVADGPRYVVNVVLGPKTDPTEPPGPGLPTPTGGIPDEDDDSDGFMMQAVRGIANLFGVSFGVGKTILGMLLALGIGTATAKQLKGGAQEFGMGMLGGVVLGVLIGLLPIWVLVLLVLIVGLWIGQRYMSGGDS